MQKARQTEKPLSLLHLRLFQVDWVRVIPARWRMRDERSPYWRLYRNDDPGMRIESDGEMYDIAPGRIALIPAGVRFSGVAAEEIGQFYIHFDVLGLPLRLRQSAFQRIQMLNAPLEQAKGLERLASAAARRETIRLDWRQECQAKAIVYEAMGLAWEQMLETERSRHAAFARTLEPILPALQAIEDAPERKTSNAELARLCCMNVDYFIRRFRESVGATPAQYLRERRFTLAAQLLAITDKTVEAIAAESGFGGRSHFTHAFAAAMGVSPAAYRRQCNVQS